MYRAILMLLLLTSSLVGAEPRTALVLNGQSLYRNGVPYAASRSVGPWSRVEYEDDGATYTAGPQAPATDQRDWLAASTFPQVSIVVNDVATPLVVDPSITKATIYKAKQTELQVEAYPSAFFCRLRYRILSTDKIDNLSLRLGNIAGREEQFNLRRDGPWDGRIACNRSTGEPLCVYVLDAREKYPRGYTLKSGNLDLYLHTNELPKDETKEGVYDLRSYLTGTLSTPLTLQYAAYLTNDPEIKEVCGEMSATDQLARRSDAYISIDFWLSNEPVKPSAPLVLLTDYESPIWWKIKPGVGNESLQQAERWLLNLAQTKLAGGPRGSILYGDFPEQPPSVSWYRIRGNNHYFWTTLAWRSFLRTESPEWYSLARAFQNYDRDSCWRDGWHDHGKGLLPWSGTVSTNGHWVDSESLLFAYLCDGDYLSLMEYQRWLTAFTLPTQLDRETQVAIRQCRVAFWFTGEPKWSNNAVALETKLQLEVERIKQTQAYKDFGVGLPAGSNWHPLAYVKPLNLDLQRHEGILAIREYAGKQKLADLVASIQSPQYTTGSNQLGFGPLGEGFAGLQLENTYEYYRGRKAPKAETAYYGLAANNYSTIIVEKTDGNASQLRVYLNTRKPGDILPQKVWLTGPSGVRTDLTAGKLFPTYVNSGQGWVPSKEFPLVYVNGLQAVLGTFPFNGSAGRYVVEVGGSGHAIVYCPISKYNEWQDCRGDFAYAGKDSSGNWPAGSVLVGSQ